MTAANAVDRQAEYFESGQWAKLAVDVMSIGFGGDKEWFYLGRAAEGLGYLDVAEKYYGKSLSKGFGCKCIGSTVCSTLEFPEVTEQRVGAVQASLRNSAIWSEYEQGRNNELQLQAHVSFYQCKRWAKGKSSEELRAFMAAMAAGAASGIVAGQIVDSGSVAENALMGAAIGISTEATARIYRDIRFPASDNRGKDFAYLFDECMDANGLYTDDDRLAFAGWKFTNEETAVLVGLRGKVRLIKELGAGGCSMQLQYINQHSEITNPTIEITLFDSDKQSLSEHVVSYPSIFPQRSHLAELDVSEDVCDSADMGYVSNATDQASGLKIAELEGRSIFTCYAGDVGCQDSASQ